MQYFYTAKSIFACIGTNRPIGTGQAVKIGGPVRFEDGGGIPEK